MIYTKTRLAASKLSAAILYVAPFAIAFGLELAVLAAIGVLR